MFGAFPFANYFNVPMYVVKATIVLMVIFLITGEKARARTFVGNSAQKGMLIYSKRNFETLAASVAAGNGKRAIPI